MVEDNSKFFEDLCERRLLRSLLPFLALIFVTYSLVDVPRRFMGGSAAMLLLVDVTILLLFAYYFRTFSVRRDSLDGLRFMPVEFKLFFIGLVIIILYSFINPVYPSFLLNAMAIRTYILPIPMLLIGYHFFRSWSDPLVVTRVERFLMILGSLIATIAFLQYGLKQVGYEFLAPLEHDHHSFYTMKIELVSSVFVSSKKFGRFMLFIMILYWLSRNKQNKSFGLVGLYFLAAIFISGSREALVIAILFLVLATGFGGGRLKRNRLRAPKMSRGVKLLILLPLLIVILAILSSLSDRVQFFLAVDDPLNYVRRIAQFFPMFAINVDEDAVLFGMGAARYGQETKLVPELRTYMEGFVGSLFLSKVAIGSTLLTFSDSGLTKIIIEFGVSGIMVWMLPLVFLVRRVVPAVFKNQGPALHYALAYMVLAWMVFFLKAHQVLSEFFMSSLFYFLLGGFVFTLKLTNETRRYHKLVRGEMHTMHVQGTSAVP